ncbi:MAG TPA: hypothetical protein DCG19_09000 [Cryomorphaceae bacterium]|nr:hypothetical protein [Owenweeksia sp.]MBF97637.1 hypothetical protein [Owenweeksia sp.]HAD97531.1 hypothetical protein [Cryomorphaceae bacterium]HCQ15282.1 hypothetical protein [Cryomorphaceae bacterium]|tara:strand:- start:690 stop:1355 length:666 start_codon:yes stop_codon:yes gene_type:complete
MQYFTEDFLDFFKELAANNNKEWFDENRRRYKASVKEPFDHFVGDLILNIRKLDNRVLIEAKDATFRINRDIRFSPNKDPYKLDRSAVISPAGRKDHSVPGFYLSFGPEHTMFGGGAYFMTPEKLARTRFYIASNPKDFQRILNDPAFKKHFTELKGEENKRLPKELQEAAVIEPLIYKKQMYYMTELEPETILRDDLMDLSMSYYKASQGVQNFLADSMV